MGGIANQFEGMIFKEDEYTESELNNSLKGIKFKILADEANLHKMKEDKFIIKDYSGGSVSEYKVNFADITHDYKHPPHESLRSSTYYIRLLHKGETFCYFAGGGNISERIMEIYMHHELLAPEEFIKAFDDRLRRKEDVCINTCTIDIINYQLTELKSRQ